MKKSTFESFLDTRNKRESDIFKEKFDKRKSNNQMEICKIHHESLKQANDELLYKLFVEQDS
ncbi:hypothetical protein [Staphylococcus succinus]|uniref:hypothetical protein n=1 Tax=Staphylococcus succinus TaxID=61015 RepID=UPI0009362A71|nr:hypothetical protein [Staphylococcus succinus]